MRIFHDLTGQGDVVLKGLGGGVDHDGGEAVVHAALAELERVAMIEMQADRKTGLDDSGFDQLDEIGAVGIFARTGGDLQDHRGLAFLRRFRNTLNNLHIIHIKCADCIASVVGFFKHFF